MLNDEINCLMKRQPVISVIIPVYNTEKYLEASVRSVMDQTYRNIEIICVNDGFADSSLEFPHAAKSVTILAVNRIPHLLFILLPPLI
mgnify:CR=1 FL=1